MHTSTDKDGIGRIVTIADPGWEPAPSTVSYPNLEGGEAEREADAAKDTKDTKDTK